MNYYNDNDPKSVAWLRELIKQNIIPAGDVDERSITDVTGSDLKGYTQIHMFAGIGGWAEALRLAGWPTTQPIWTGSCPCQPFSCAGQRKGEKDKRHLWPEFRRLIAECNPPIVFGEQVASADGRKWLSGVRSDLENLGYAVGAADLCAAGVGAPHIRQRLYWVANAESPKSKWDGAEQNRKQVGFTNSSDIGGLGNTESVRRGILNPEDIRQADGEIKSFADTSDLQLRGLGNTDEQRSQGFIIDRNGSDQRSFGEASVVNFWSNSIWLPCADGKARRIEPESFPLVDGLPGRVGLLRGYGNAIVPEVAAEIVKAFMEM